MLKAEDEVIVVAARLQPYDLFHSEDNPVFSSPFLSRYKNFKCINLLTRLAVSCTATLHVTLCLLAPLHKISDMSLFKPQG